MSNAELLLICVCVLLLAVCSVLIIKIIRIRKRLDGLSLQTENYFAGGGAVPFSTKDDAFSRLENEIAELCEALELQKQKNKDDNIKNAEFVADVSHQLKTPLAGIRLYCEMAQSENPTENGEKQIKLLDRTEKLVYNLLRLQKLKADACELHFKENALEEIIAEISGELCALYPEKRITVTGSASLRCDRDRLHEAFLNIIKNACEHTAPDGLVDITVEKSDNAVFIVFDDNGGGVRENDLPGLFTRFYKTANSAAGGTGLGLAVAQAIIAKHHGVISAENTSQGLKITICLPVLSGIIKS